MEKTIEKIDIRSLNYKELQEEMTRIGEKAFRGKQIYEWLHVKLADSFQEMTNLSRSLQGKAGSTVCDPQGGYAGASDIEEGSYGKIPL